MSSKERSAKRPARRRQNREAGLCSCGKDRAENRKSCAACLESASKSKARRKSSGKCVGCGSEKQSSDSAYCPKCLQYFVNWRKSKPRGYNSASVKKYYKQLKDETFNAYGGWTCACCGESDPKFLSFDHVYDDGHVDRKMFGDNRILWIQLRKQGFPEKNRYQILCFNCNFGRAINGGFCPHVESAQKGK